MILTISKKSLNILKTHKFKHIKINYKYNPYYDISAYKNKKKVYIEVKYNDLVDKLGTVFLEVCKRNLEVSGISITKAHYYIFHSRTKYWICETDKIKKLLKKKLDKEFEKVGIKNFTNEQLCSYIQYEGIKTTNTIGVLLNIKSIEKKALYKGFNN